jgi:hypothetical protein
MKTLSLPQHFNPSNAAKWDYRPDMQKLFNAATEAIKSQSIPSSTVDKKSLHLLIIDAQKALYTLEEDQGEEQ